MPTIHDLMTDWDPEEDLGMFCAHCRTYDPYWDGKEAHCNLAVNAIYYGKEYPTTLKEEDEYE